MQRLTATEELVMCVIWTYDQSISVMRKINGKQVESVISDPYMIVIRQICTQRYHKKWATQTVSTFLARLVRKGYLTSYRVNSCTYYIPVFTMDEYRTQKILDMRDLLFAGDMDSMRRFLSEIPSDSVSDEVYQDYI